MNKKLKYKQYFEIKESDFYPPPDDRVLISYVEDVENEDNFLEFTKYIFDLYEQEDYYEN